MIVLPILRQPHSLYISLQTARRTYFFELGIERAQLKPLPLSRYEKWGLPLRAENELQSRPTTVCGQLRARRKHEGQMMRIAAKSGQTYCHRVG